ncbi:hypothetical protein HIM_06861 [Hirsutella minnesotensis 3608]|uniref:MADS-box MEF2 type transcription factor MIG1 n=1 Tax=Hirsutella minnesotensis 3608 TaxID=1043627 RepID=A0A0F7ZTU9_9HYPO|nr:hypothetical protein HIM_06861 [Hirsutella minnesotensis 3608]
MGRRKIEIKAIKDDRNRSVTFLKRKGGLFKKAHELSVLCSVDVAVFIFGNNKKLYEYSSSDMRELIHRYSLHGTINEHKGPSDFNGGNNDEEDEEDADGTPPHAPEGVEPQMMPPQFHGQQPPFSQILRHHTPSASPPVANGVPYHAHHPGHHPRGGTPQPPMPQPPMGSRPSSRNDGPRMGPNMVPQPVPGPQGPHPGIAYMPTPPIYNPPASQPGMMPQHAGHYPYPPAHQPYMEERRPSAPPGYATQHPPPPPPPPPHTAQMPARTEPSPPQPNPQHLPPHPMPYVSPPTPQPVPGQPPQETQPQAPPVELKMEPMERPQPPQPLLLNTDSAIRKMPQRKSHSIFTPIEENRSILSQHLASFAAEPHAVKAEAAAPSKSRSQSVDTPGSRDETATASPKLKRTNTQGSIDNSRKPSLSSGPEAAFTPPSRNNSLATNATAGGARPRGPRLTVQIPDGGSEHESAGAESNSPQNPGITPTAPQRQNSHSSVVLPPPSPSASALLSAGASGPPNPFARPPPQQNVNETPVSALPSRFLNNELLPSPSSFYPDWNFRPNDNNTLPSPLNFATPVVGSGPSFLRDDNHASSATSHSNTSNAAVSATSSSSNGASNLPSSSMKRKSPDHSSEGRGAPAETKRVKVEYA